jgi:hypothetical protein
MQITHSTVHAPSHTEGFGLIWTGSNLCAGTAFNYQGNNFDWTDGPSVDQAVAKRIGSATPFSSIELAAMPNGGNEAGLSASRTQQVTFSALTGAAAKRSPGPAAPQRRATSPR